MATHSDGVSQSGRTDERDDSGKRERGGRKRKERRRGVRGGVGEEKVGGEKELLDGVHGAHILIHTTTAAAAQAAAASIAVATVIESAALFVVSNGRALQSVHVIIQERLPGESGESGSTSNGTLAAA
jgi:hypothetical protein